ncbi:MAG: hypothetical protein FWH48_03615 [Oscillospiraceae bacterium]|nr:hypothetical protein [Oscillospiraceae bacterium]
MKKIKKIIAAALVLSLCMSLGGLPFAVGGQSGENSPDSFGMGMVGSGATAAIAGKNEVVYARLSPSGEPGGVYVVNHFELDSSGAFFDYGDYSSVVNLTNTSPIEINNGEVFLASEGGEFFYQGNLEGTDLPWVYSIEYSLDGKKILPEELAGQSGELEMRIASSQNQKANAVFHENYMQQLTVTLNIHKCKNIEASGATVANAGTNRMLVYTILPNADANITIKAQVTDFEMAGIEIAAMPFSMSFELPDTGDMQDKLEKLSGGIATLDDGAKQLDEGASELESGANELKRGSSEFGSGLSELALGLEKLREGAAGLEGGAAELASGAVEFGGGLFLLDENSKLLAQGSAQILDALSQVENSLNSIDLSEADSALAQLPAGLNELADALAQVLGGMNSLKESYLQAHAALDEAILAIPEPQITEGQVIEIIAKASESERAVLMHLVDGYLSAMTVKGTYERAKPAFSAVGSTLETLSASVDFIAATLTEIAGQIGEALAGDEMAVKLMSLTEGISQIFESYSEFHDGLFAYAEKIGELADGYGTLEAGLSGLYGGISETSRGIGEIYVGANDAKSGYGELDAGLAEFFDGVSKLCEGTAELYTGTSQMAKETADMPGQIQDEIDNMLEKYKGGEFEAVSFASGKNQNVSFVQFVIRTDAIEKPKAETKPRAEEKQQNFWERLFGLFGKS